ncbi:putative Ribose/xylose/arabinose/galactoside ABC-type transport system, permease component [Vibrio nigripulchritudo SFn27]|uniref:Putative Ribose/xylose/arabinose/galactoside ABC-type transport system, permease component n=1 Tax=Vibrio nigripulchritudo TaxID=28173 RepID=U4JUY9_9VIBR|nr:ABC transporter permease [Vibrio nigripulchritudo]CCN83172.1 putative Ribose/xylose/arabinose/galactoside ABC-type transport system, permease component [Vibrio nigripulchritudo BLFn1]CCN88645.1 putative Ribose/xylose/arabinose/galactoside ABC-type transport system, permease component [Vibrio nigripulchritudo SFn27]CCN92784.1 putative Ribose/xylose/arabinose/galactoside ABC-type transport system, permease component [Vibrio nigripulchritudo ENn2]CCO40370.1 putative Ribose/xylose/arabinose/gala
MTKTNAKRAAFIRVGLYLVIVAAITLAFYIVEPRYVTSSNITAILRHLAATGLAALGLTFVVVLKKFDLSFPGIISFVAMTIGYGIAAGIDLYLSIFIGLLVSIAFGVINGYAVSYLKLPDIVTTIAVGSIAGGAAFLFSGGPSIFRNFFTSGLLDINDGRWFGLNYSTYLLVAMYALSWFYLHRSRFGNSLYAVGYNEKSAFYSGVNVRKYTCIAYVLCSTLMLFSALLVIAETGKSEPIAGNGFLMPAFASVFIGIAFFGRASVLATLAGTVLISMVLNGFTLINIPYYWSDGATSMLMLVGSILFSPDTRDKVTGWIKARFHQVTHA